MKVFVVYQCGIANVFKVDCFNLSDYGRNAARIYQGDFRTAESIAYGMALMGATVRTCGCNRAGDIAREHWTDDLESLPFNHDFQPIHQN